MIHKLWKLEKIEIQDVEDYEERENDSNEDEFCPECNNYIGKKGSFITVFHSVREVRTIK